jgi:hypothetical protein
MPGRPALAGLPGLAALAAVPSATIAQAQGGYEASYVAGYDANKAAAHNTAWVVRANSAVIFGAR